MSVYQEILVGNQSIRYEEKASDKKKIIFFIHGLGALPKFYESFLISLSKKYRVISPWLPGLAYVENPPVTIQENVKILKQFIESFAFDEYFIVGHSIGANISQEIAENNQKCKKVVMINPAFSMNLLSIKHSFEILAKDIFNKTGEVAGLIHNINVALGYTKNILMNPINFMKLAIKAMTVDHRKYQYSQDCLIMHSDHDIYFKLTNKDINYLQKEFPQVKIEMLDGYSHNWLLYFPEIREKIIFQFLDQ